MYSIKDMAEWTAKESKIAKVHRLLSGKLVSWTKPESSTTSVLPINDFPFQSLNSISFVQETPSDSDWTIAIHNLLDFFLSLVLSIIVSFSLSLSYPQLNTRTLTHSRFLSSVDFYRPVFLPETQMLFILCMFKFFSLYFHPLAQNRK